MSHAVPSSAAPPGMRPEGPSERPSVSTLELTILMTALALSPVVIFLRFHSYRSIVIELALIAAVAGMALVVAMVTRHRPIAQATILAVLTTWMVDIGFEVDLPVPGIGPMKLLAALLLASFGLMLFRRTVTVHIGTAIAVTVLGSSLLTPPGPTLIETGQVRGGGSGPLLLHLVLDEHIGIAGLSAQPVDTAIAEEVRASFERAGFLVFGGAYSQDVRTFKSLSRLFNPTAGVNGVEATAGLFDYEFTANEYFERLVRDGYELQVLQSIFLNFCPSNLQAACRSSDFRRARTAQFESLPLAQRLDIMAFLLAGQSDVWRFVRRFVDVGWGPAADRTVEISPLNAIARLDDLAAIMSRAKPGEAYFAHVGSPHYPYAYDRDCVVRPIGEWLERSDSRVAPRINSAEGRRARYEQYVGQVRCAVRSVEKIVAAIPASMARDSIIIVQGDHGSRITEHNPGDPRSNRSDFIDAYSTLFAVRAPGISAGYRTDQISLVCLFRGLINAGFGTVPDVSACGATEPVFDLAPAPVGVMPRFVTAGH